MLAARTATAARIAGNHARRGNPYAIGALKDTFR